MHTVACSLWQNYSFKAGAQNDRASGPQVQRAGPGSEVILLMYCNSTIVQNQAGKSQLQGNVGIGWLVLTLRLVNRE